MARTRVGGWIVLVLAMVYAVGCATNGTQSEPEVTTPDPSTTSVQPEPRQVEPEPVPVQTRPEVRGTRLWIPSDSTRGAQGGGLEALTGKFYFDFDEAIVKRAGHAELNQHASHMARDRNARLRLEGHADERGTREYNLALGERRANAVRAYLMSQGARSSQIEVVSYGEEKPADAGHNESAWAKNRRVELIYQ